MRALTGLGHSLGIGITAEGVETTEQMDRLLAEDCTELQGFLFGRPCPAADLPALLQQAGHTPKLSPSRPLRNQFGRDEQHGQSEDALALAG